MSHIESQSNSRLVRVDSVIALLESIKNTLVKVNNTCGSLARFREIKAEIETHGWSKVCLKYHPDVNVDDPSAHQLFALYRFVYTNMDRF